MFSAGRQTRQDTNKAPSPKKKNESPLDIREMMNGLSMAFGASEPVQMQEEEEEEVQMKEAPVQKLVKEEEEKPQQKKAVQKAANREEKEKVQMKASSENPGTSFQSPGITTKMPEGVQAKMENSFGASFGNVNVHQNDNSATEMGALAYTQGNDVHFAPGQYNPNTQAGQELLGHELTHVVQQRAGRVKGTKQGKGMTVNDSPALENEADVMGKRAAGGRKVEEISNTGIGIQKVAPIAAIGAWLASLGAAEAISLAGLGLATAVTAGQVGSAIMNGQSGVQTFQINNPWMSEFDKKNLQIITTYRLVNKFAEKLTENNIPLSEEGRVKEYIGLIKNAIKAEVEKELIEELNKNQKEIPLKEYIWSDSGAHTADTFGTVGAVQFIDVKATYLCKLCYLNQNASQIEGLGEAMPNLGEMLEVEQLRGGRLERGDSFDLGLNDDLGINLVGNAPTIDQSGNRNHGSLTFATEWMWDNGTSHADFTILSRGGEPNISVNWRGEPHD